MRPPCHGITSINISKEMSFERRDDDASKALLHLPLDLVTVSTSGNISSLFAGGYVQAIWPCAPVWSKSRAVLMSWSGYDEQ
jgi:hypothetical protein